MKKIRNFAILLAVVLVAGVTIFYACTKEKEEDSTNNVRALKKELVALNDRISSQIEIQKPSKGFWSGVGKVCAVAGSDIIGAAAGAAAVAKPAAAAAAATANPAVGGAIVAGGAIVCGVGASYATGVSLSASISDPYPDGYTKQEYFDSYGDLHNKYLDLLYKNPNADSQFIYNQIFKDNLEHLDIENYNKIVEIVGKNSQCFKKVESLVDEYIRSDFDIDIFLDQSREKLEMSQETEIIWRSFFEIYPSVTKIEDACFVVQEYEKFIDNSGKTFLKKDEIMPINCALSVARSSTNYWPASFSLDK